MIVCKGSHGLTEFFFCFLTTLFNQISRSPMWAMRKVEVHHIPVAVGGLGVIPQGLNKSLQNISKRVRPGQVQTTAFRYYELQEYNEEFLRVER